MPRTANKKNSRARKSSSKSSSTPKSRSRSTNRSTKARTVRSKSTSKSSKTKSKTVSRSVVITDPSEAKKIFGEYLSKTSPTNENYRSHTVGRSTTRGATTQQIAKWYASAKRKNLDVGWFGRSLNAASGVKTTRARVDGRTRTIFRKGR